MSTDAPTAAWRVRTQPNTVPRSAKVPPATDLGATRPARRRSRARWLWITALAGALALALAVVGFGALVWSWVDQRHVLLPGSTTGVTYLLVGSDSRAFVHSASDRARFGPGSATGPERADIALLVRRVGGHTTVLDVPRDLVVLSTGSAPTRYVLTLTDGLQSLVDVTCHSLGIGVDHVALVHFDGLRGAVDAVGGVDVTFSTPLRDRVTGLLVPAAGRHLLDGQQALALVRARTLEREVAGRWEPVPPSADQRGGHACEVLAALGARGGLSVGAPVSSARKLLAFSAAVTVDDTMGPTGLRSLAHTLAAVGTAHEVQLPVQFRAGFVPRALAEPAALSVLRRFGGPSGACAARLPLQAGAQP